MVTVTVKKCLVTILYRYQSVADFPDNYDLIINNRVTSTPFPLVGASC